MNPNDSILMWWWLAVAMLPAAVLAGWRLWVIDQRDRVQRVSVMIYHPAAHGRCRFLKGNGKLTALREHGITSYILKPLKQRELYYQLHGTLATRLAPQTAETSRARKPSASREDGIMMRPLRVFSTATSCFCTFSFEASLPSIAAPETKVSDAPVRARP